jgi:hypothetical protein
MGKPTAPFEHLFGLVYVGFKLHIGNLTHVSPSTQNRKEATAPLVLLLFIHGKTCSI